MSKEIINNRKRSERRKITAEDFTPKLLISNMIKDMLLADPSVFSKGKTILDPACGNGNLLIGVLEYRISNGLNALESISTIYGCDIMKDNIEECQIRLLTEAKKYLNKTELEEAINIVCKNIVCTPLSKFERGSLDYNFEFDKNPHHMYIKKIKKILNG